MADIFCAIAGELGLSELDTMVVRFAGLIHDVGKIGVPSEILTKPRTLTDIEMAMVRQHAAAGGEIMKQIQFPWPVAEIVRQHHERWDGSGYPDGLKGTAIRREARILAVADVVEAMATHRPFRAAIGAEAALAEIEANKGTLYDLEVAEACLAVFRKGEFALEQ